MRKIPITTNPQEETTKTDLYLPVAQFTKGGLDPYCNFQVSAHQRKPTAACNLVLQTPIFMLRSTNCVARNPKFRKPSNFLQGTKITSTVIPVICHHALYRNATPRGSIRVKVTQGNNLEPIYYIQAREPRSFVT